MHKNKAMTHAGKNVFLHVCILGTEFSWAVQCSKHVFVFKKKTTKKNQNDRLIRATKATHTLLVHTKNTSKWACQMLQRKKVFCEDPYFKNYFIYICDFNRCYLFFGIFFFLLTGRQQPFRAVKWAEAQIPSPLLVFFWASKKGFSNLFHAFSFSFTILVYFL